MARNGKVSYPISLLFHITQTRVANCELRVWENQIVEYIIEMVEGFQDTTWPRIHFQLVL